MITTPPAAPRPPQVVPAFEDDESCVPVSDAAKTNAGAAQSGAILAIEIAEKKTDPARVAGIRPAGPLPRRADAPSRGNSLRA
jgi:hypothetical protein